jgi:hypothetical protein
MQVVCAAHSLAGAGGSETYVVTVADHLQRLGHDVWVYTTQTGRSTEAAQRLGLRVVALESDLPQRPDALLVQDGVVACDLAAQRPAVPQVFVAHSDTFDVQLPPQLPGLVAAVIVLYDRVEDRIRALAEPIEDVVRLTQPIDVERFKPTQPLHARPRVAMALGNYVHGERLEMLRRACARAGIELRHVGQFGEGERPADQVLGDADIIFGKARVILEAMACGRAAYVFDHNGGDGWVTAATYPELAPDNFGGQSERATIDEDRIAADLALYHRNMGVVNRDLVVANHAASRHAAAVAAVLGRVAATPRAAPVDAPLRELSRLIRLYHRADSQAFALRAECEALGARTMRAEQRAGELSAQLAARASLEAELADARRAVAAHGEEVARLERRLDAVMSSQRWRTLQAVLAPVDRIRRNRAAAAPGPAPLRDPVRRS